jgi:transcriptional regulator of aromatic amino acid metabolism
MNPKDIKTLADVRRWLAHHVEWTDIASEDMAAQALTIIDAHLEAENVEWRKAYLAGMIRARHRTLDEAIRNGARLGLQRAFKHVPMPKALASRLGVVVEAIVDAVWLGIDEVLDVRDEP